MHIYVKHTEHFVRKKERFEILLLSGTTMKSMERCNSVCMCDVHERLKNGPRGTRLRDRHGANSSGFRFPLWGRLSRFPNSWGADLHPSSRPIQLPAVFCSRIRCSERQVPWAAVHHLARSNTQFHELNLTASPPARENKKKEEKKTILPDHFCNSKVN